MMFARTRLRLLTMTRLFSWLAAVGAFAVFIHISQGSALAQTDYSKFRHDNRDHARLPCLLCHRRDDNSAQPTLPGNAAHAPCTGCHQQQFANTASEICTI